ncbi:MAG: hypothetical protein AAGL34_07925 [Bacteroidota bacterium]
MKNSKNRFIQKLIVLPIFLMVLIVSSCSNDEEADTIDSKLVGSWSGTYSGDDRGVWTVNVNASGNVTGTATSTFTTDSAAISGSVSSNGTLSATLGNSENREFVGQLEEDNTASGTWVDTQRDQTGTWVGQKN